MNKKNLLASLLVGGACLWLALHGIVWRDVGAAFRDLRWTPVLLVALTMPTTFWFRTRRWDVMLRPLGQVKPMELFAMNSVGFLAIMAFPLRLGEIVRPLLLKRRKGISLSAGIATIAVERVFDGLVATLALIVGVMAAPRGSMAVSMLGLGFRGLAWLAVLIFVPALLFCLLAVVKREMAMAVAGSLLRLFPPRTHKRAMEIVGNFITGLESLPSVGSFARLFAESLGVWGAVVASYWLGCAAFGLDLHWSASFTMLGLAALGVMIPGAPGFVGTFQLAIVAALAVYGVPKSVGFAVSVVLHTVNLLYIVAAGLTFLPYTSTKIGLLFDEAAHSESPSDG